MTWPRSFKVTTFEQQREVRRFFTVVAGYVLGATCMVEDVEGLLGKLHEDDAVIERMAMTMAAPTSYHPRLTERVTSV